MSASQDFLLLASVLPVGGVGRFGPFGPEAVHAVHRSPRSGLTRQTLLGLRLFVQGPVGMEAGDFARSVEQGDGGVHY